MTDTPYDAILIVSFGGPEAPQDVTPFLENVTRGRNVPADRLAEVAEHYQHFGGRSPHNDQVRDLLAALEPELAAHGIDLPVYWGNRNWHPMLADTMRQMADDGVKRALAFFVSAYSSYSGCRQYRENIADAQQTVGPRAPIVDKVRVFYNHPGFIGPMRDRVGEAIEHLPAAFHDSARLVFTAHSIPSSMAGRCNYEQQLRDACSLVAEVYPRHPHHAWDLVWQSRSGPPQVPWLEPDICDHLNALADAGERAVVVVPIGFLSDHLEVIWDLDHEAAHVAAERKLHMVRAATVGTHPRFIAMIRELIEERLDPVRHKLALGDRGPSHDVCPADCCLLPQRPKS